MEEYYLMWLSRIDGVGIKRIQILLDYFQTAQAIWSAKREQLLSIKGISEKIADAILSSKNEQELESWIDELETKEIQFYSFRHPKYPALLKEIYNPPIGIYVKGTLPEDDIDKISLIGARRCSRYGANVAYQMAKDIVKANIVIVSGMAKGIDTMAHKGAIDGFGQTIAVLGCGVDVCYPIENKELMEQIINNGCLISEYPPGTKASPLHFPKRNRIISGLSKILVVVEAGKRSGTLITVDLALESGRDVFAVPGNVTSALSQGTNDLIKQGCPPVTESDDILIKLGITYKNEEQETFSKAIVEKLTLEEKEVYDEIIDKEPVLAETICRKLHKNIQEVQYILSLLEIAGFIRKIPQSGYIRES
ncbi:MAG: DNA-processing protein DprA [Anaerotignum sp.]